MLVSVCMIVRNEEETLPLALASTAGLLDELVIVDTGSQDGTKRVAAEYGARWIEGADRYHKAQARNLAQDAANGEWVVVLDADERIADPAGLRQHLETTKADALYIRLVYMDANNQPTLEYSQMRCWRRGAYEYKYRAHEVPLPVDGWGKVEYTDFVWEHRPPPDRQWKREYTLKRLLLDVEENPQDPRPLYYLGRQYLYLNDHPNAAKYLTRYLNTPGQIDRAEAYGCLAACHAAAGDRERQLDALHLAARHQPQRRRWWGELAQVYHDLGQDWVAFALCALTLCLPKPERVYVSNVWYGAHIYDLAARICWKLGDYGTGLYYATSALDLDPDNPRLKDNLEWFTRKLEPANA